MGGLLLRGAVLAEVALGTAADLADPLRDALASCSSASSAPFLPVFRLLLLR